MGDGILHMEYDKITSTDSEEFETKWKQKESSSNKTQEIKEDSTDEQYPSTKAVYNYVEEKINSIETSSVLHIPYEVINNYDELKNKINNSIISENYITVIAKQDIEIPELLDYEFVTIPAGYCCTIYYNDEKNITGADGLSFIDGYENLSSGILTETTDGRLAIIENVKYMIMPANFKLKHPKAGE